MAAGCAHTVAVGREGEVWTFGNGSAGQLGHGSTATEFRPRLLMSLGGTRVVQVAAGRSRTILVSEGGSVYRLGKDCFGDQEYALQSPQPIQTPRLVETLKGIWAVQVAMGSFFTGVLSREGRVHTLAWGGSQGGRLGHATDVTDSLPRPLEGPLGDLPVAQIAGGHCYLLALACGERRSLWSVGCGLGGKLGHGSRSDEKMPKEIEHFKSIDFQPMAVAAGAWHATSLSTDGRVATWGWGRHGCLGHGSDQCELVPRVVEGLEVPEGSNLCHVAAGDYTTFLVGSGGEVWSFGNAESSCLGLGEDGAGGGGGGILEDLDGDGEDEGDRPHRRKDVFHPTRIPALELLPRGDRVVQVSPSNSGHWDAHMLALTENGTVFACGAGSQGQLGAQLLGRAYERRVPEIVESLVL